MSEARRADVAWRAHAATWCGVGLVALALWVWWPSKPAPTATTRVAVAGAAPTAKTEQPRRRPPVSAITRAQRVPSRPVIDEVLVEKRSVCEGEENLITVIAHSDDGGSLRYIVGGERGSSVPVRAFLEPDGTQPTQYVRVLGASDVEASVPIPRYEVRPCRAPRWIELQLRQRPNAEAHYEVTATLRSTPGEPKFEAASFEWSFGDGEKQVTSSPVTEHSYDDREQVSAYSSYLIQVTAVSTRGERLVGRRGIELLNAAFDDLERVGHVTLLNRPTPRAPQLGADGRVVQRFQIHHVHKQPVLLDQVVVRGHTRDDDGDAQAEELDPTQVLGLDEIPTGRGVEVTLSFDAARESGLFMKSFELSGHTPDGLPASGRLTIMRPQQPPTRDDHVPVDDPALIAKIIAAQRLLDKEIVSQDEIYMLERDGRLAEEMRRTAVGPPPSPTNDMPTHLPMRNGLAVLETIPGGDPSSGSPSAAAH
jgi:hypothetical protein